MNIEPCFWLRTWLIKLFEFGSTKSKRQINAANHDVRNEIKTISAFLYCQKPISLFPTAHSIFSSSWLNIFFVENLENQIFCMYFVCVPNLTFYSFKDKNYNLIWKFTIYRYVYELCKIIYIPSFHFLTWLKQWLFHPGISRMFVALKTSHSTTVHFLLNQYLAFY